MIPFNDTIFDLVNFFIFKDHGLFLLLFNIIHFGCMIILLYLLVKEIIFHRKKLLKKFNYFFLKENKSLIFIILIFSFLSFYLSFESLIFFDEQNYMIFSKSINKEMQPGICQQRTNETCDYFQISMHGTAFSYFSSLFYFNNPHSFEYIMKVINFLFMISSIVLLYLLLSKFISKYFSYLLISLFSFNYLLITFSTTSTIEPSTLFLLIFFSYFLYKSLFEDKVHFLILFFTSVLIISNRIEYILVLPFILAGFLIIKKDFSKISYFFIYTPILFQHIYAFKSKTILYSSGNLNLSYLNFWITSQNILVSILLLFSFFYLIYLLFSNKSYSFFKLGYVLIHFFIFFTVILFYIRIPAYESRYFIPILYLPILIISISFSYLQINLNHYNLFFKSLKFIVTFLMFAIILLNVFFYFDFKNKLMSETKEKRLFFNRLKFYDTHRPGSFIISSGASYLSLYFNNLYYSSRIDSINFSNFNKTYFIENIFNNINMRKLENFNFVFINNYSPMYQEYELVPSKNG